MALSNAASFGNKIENSFVAGVTAFSIEHQHFSGLFAKPFASHVRKPFDQKKE